ncbi:hypothetical protein [Nitratireductor pacificus]|uniref:Uncharacterized protein n=1 Tax=Nitratireductor pacificus pht-3B TaxID=391937 RepID=K2MIT9_9HYPH|nr:hypothetical protein [Nitratireductor pacificus]EKF17077.1 hypothetical protein NA2_19943 [Nitratireductor pacificus pht-3B]
MKASVTFNQQEFERKLAKDLGRDLPFAAARALTWTAKDIQTNSRKWMMRVFDRPTRWTLNAAFVRPANKRGLSAEVYFKDFAPKGTPAGKYLMTQIKGGRRPHTRWEKRLIHAGIMLSTEHALPGKGLKLNAHGNVPRGVYSKVLAQLQLGDSRTGNESRASKAAKGRRGAARYFVSYGKDAPRIGSVRPTGLPRGIWQRDRRGAISPVFVFVSAAPDYADIFDWKRWAAETARARLPINFKRSADLILRRPNR